MSSEPVAHQVVPGEAGAESATASRGAARPRESWFHLCGTVDAIRQTADPREKLSLLEPYFLELDAHTIGPAARILSGTVHPNGGTTPFTIPRTVTAGVIRSLTRASADHLLELTMKLGDLGDAAGEVFSGRLPSGLPVVDVEAWLRNLTATETDDARVPLLRDMLAKLSGIEAQYIVRITDGGLNVGLNPSMIDDAIATTFGAPVHIVRQARTELHDIGLVAERAKNNQL